MDFFFFFFNINKGIPTSDYKREGDTNSQEPCPPPSSSERIKYIAQFFFFLLSKYIVQVLPIKI